MAILIIQHLNQTTAGVFRGAVIIGRKAGHAIVIDSPVVSRRHAKVTKSDGQYFVSDMDSRTGTRVNGLPVDRQMLNDGDEIAIGPAKILFRRGVPFPKGVQPVALVARGTFRKENSERRHFGCPCGKVMEVALPLAAKYAKCGWCRQIVVIPEPVEATVATPSIDLAEPCSVCLSAMAASDEIISCPECALRFHAECWAENHGCSAYGCSQVGVLDTATPADDSDSDLDGEIVEDVGAARPIDSILHAANAARGWFSRRGSSTATATRDETGDGE